MCNNYILDENGNPKLETDVMAWATWFETANRVIKETKVDESEVSTVFLGLDYNFADKGLPLLYETMVFGGRLNGECNRYPTQEMAEIGHEEMVIKCKKK